MNAFSPAASPARARVSAPRSASSPFASKNPREAVVSVGGFWQPKYSIPNEKMVEAVQLLARTEAILLDPVYTGKIMAGLIGLAREGYFKPNEQVLFLHTGGLPSLHAYEDVVLGRVGV